MAELDGKNVLLGVSGGIAAYKSPDLVRRLREHGATVQVVMTAGASRFVTPMTFQAVSGREVRSDLWDPEAEKAMSHIELARWADLLLIAPATADLIARLSGGRADDLVVDDGQCDQTSCGELAKPRPWRPCAEGAAGESQTQPECQPKDRTH